METLSVFEGGEDPGEPGHLKGNGCFIKAGVIHCVRV